jgi:hypothetical protein
LFARLGVFASGFSLEAAETVCADDAAPAVLDGIASLVDKSLLRTEDPLHGQPRFTMLQVVRDFALNRVRYVRDRGLHHANADTVMSRANAALIAEFYADVEVRGDLGEHDTLLSIEKAKRLLGYRPAYGWRDADTSNFPTQPGPTVAGDRLGLVYARSDPSTLATPRRHNSRPGPHLQRDPLPP